MLNALGWLVRTGAPWRYLPGDFPPWETVYQQSRRWINAHVFEAATHDLRMLIRLAQGRGAAPTATIFDSRTMQSTPESGIRADYDGHKRRNGSKVHMAVDTLGQLLAPADEQDRAHVGELARHVQAVTGEHVEVAFVDQDYTGSDAAEAAQQHGIRLEVVKHAEAKRGFVLLPRRWVPPLIRGGERSFGWMSRFRRLARDYERLAEALAAYHFVAFSLLMGRVVAQVLHNAPWLQCP